MIIDQSAIFTMTNNISWKLCTYTLRKNNPKVVSKGNMVGSWVKLYTAVVEYKVYQISSSQILHNIGL